MALLIFDACALIALAEKEKGADILASFLEGDENSCFVHSINLCEVFYRAYRNHRSRIRRNNHCISRRSYCNRVSVVPTQAVSFGAEDPNAQPLEPILFPRLRIYFADFPYLHCSID